MDIYTQIATRIIEQQETIIGPVAAEQARGVTGLSVDWGKHQVRVTGDGKTVIDKLIAQYKHLFGQVSVEVSKNAVAKIVAQLPPEQLPKSLQ